jgi:hypothetical protein
MGGRKKAFQALAGHLSLRCPKNFYLLGLSFNRPMGRYWVNMYHICWFYTSSLRNVSGKVTHKSFRYRL